MKCPVCPAADLADDCVRCPVCGADLTPLQRVRQLHLAEYNRAVKFAELGATDTAMSHAASAVALDNQFVPALILLGKLLWQKGLYREAFSRWEDATRLAPENHHVRSLLAASRGQLRAKRNRRVLILAGGIVGVLAAFWLGLFLMTLYINNRLGLSVAQTARLEAAERSAKQSQVRLGSVEMLATNQFQELLASVTEVKADYVALSNQQHRFLTTVSGKLDTTTASIEALEESQRAASKEQARTTTRLGEISAALANADADIRRVHLALANLEGWTTNLAVAAVEALKPGALQELARRMTDAENTVSHLEAEELRTRHPRSLLGSIQHSRAEKNLAAAQELLAVLKMTWLNEIEPWVRIHALIATNAPSFTTNQEQPRTSAATVSR